MSQSLNFHAKWQFNIPIAFSPIFVKDTKLIFGCHFGAPLREAGFICFYETPLKVEKNAFYFMLKALFVLRIFKFLS